MYRAAVFISELNGAEASIVAQPFLEKSLRLNPELAATHVLLGFINLYSHWDSEASEKEHLLALHYAANNAEFISIYVDFLNMQRRHEEALQYANLQHSTEPFYPNSRLPLSLFYLGREKEALDFQRARLKFLHSYSSHDTYGFLNLNTGNYAEAITAFNEAIRILQKRVPRLLGWMGAAYAKSGDKVNANKLLGELTSLARKGNAGSPNFFIAVLQTALGNKEAALTALERAVEVHDWEMPWIISEPQLYPLHNEPRFVKMARTVGFRDFGTK
jgi:tetratricopeptide (TPR) repeat protein